MANQEHPYKYSCRECPIRERCIVESDTAVRMKDMIRNAFAARTDTLSTWGVLQRNCLRVKADEDLSRAAQQESLLSQRLRAAREQEGEPSTASQSLPLEETAQPEAPADGPSFSPLSIAPDRNRPEPERALSDNIPEPASPISPPPSVLATAAPAPGELQAPRLSAALLPSRPAGPGLSLLAWLTVKASRRHISLPVNGQLVLGRFDPDLDTPLDVDLTYEDQHFLTVSRRHVRIIAANGRYTVKDLGSSNGVFLNDQQVSLGLSRPLEPGDVIRLGRLQLRYDLVPADLLDHALTARLEQYLLVTFNGRRVAIRPSEDILIGRDPASQLNLSGEGEVADRVADRHALITWPDGAPHLSDLDSLTGIRINGERIPPHQPVPLKPGDHIDLGRCILAYDIRIL